MHDIGGFLDVDDSNGKILVREIRGGAQLKTTYRSLEAANIHGDATVSNSFGSIRISDVEGSLPTRGAAMAPSRPRM